VQHLLVIELRAKEHPIFSGLMRWLIDRILALLEESSLICCLLADGNGVDRQVTGRLKVVIPVLVVLFVDLLLETTEFWIFEQFHEVGRLFSTDLTL